MRTVAVVPVKPFATAKRRLAPRLDATARAALARAMYDDTIASLSAARGIDAIVVVTSCPELARTASTGGVTAVADRGAGYSAAAAIGIGHAVSAGAEQALVIPADVPLLDPAEIDQLLSRPSPAARSVVVAPDRHGDGTNGLLLRPPGAICPSYGAGSCARHLALAAAARAGARREPVASLAFDVDTPADLDLLERCQGPLRTHAPATRAVLRRLSPARRRAGAADGGRPG